MRKKTNSVLSAQNQEFVRNIVRDPCLFATHILGIELWEKEVELLQSIKNNRQTAIKACHAVGKTFALAVATLWWLARYREGIVLTTSPTQRQVRTQLWSEIHRLVKHARVPYPSFKETELPLRGKDNYALGFSTNQTENFQGYHAKNVLIIVDEAPGVEARISEAIEGIRAGGVVHIVMAGNPTLPFGPFFDAFTVESAQWNRITVSAFDSPNLKGLDLDQLLGRSGLAYQMSDYIG